MTYMRRGPGMRPTALALAVLTTALTLPAAAPLLAQQVALPEDLVTAARDRATQEAAG